MKKYIFILLSLSLTLLSCGDFQEVTFSGIENVKILQLSQQGAEVEITAKIKNPNRESFTIYPTDMDVELGGIDAGKAHLSSRVKIKGKSDAVYAFKIKSDFSKLSIADLPKLMSIAMSKNIKISLKGNLRVGKLFVKKKYPVDMNQSVPLEGLKLN